MIALAALPDSIVALVETLDEFHGAGTGMRVALKLIQSFGGLDIKFPVEPAPDHPVVQALGIDDAAILCQHLDGHQIYVPKGRQNRSAREAVLTLERQGRSRAQIARALGLSERHVRHLANTATPPAPLPLFPED